MSAVATQEGNLGIWRSLLSAGIYLAGIATAIWWLIGQRKVAVGILSAQRPAPQDFHADPESAFRIPSAVIRESVDADVASRWDAMGPISWSILSPDSLRLLVVAIGLLLLARHVQRRIPANAVIMPLVFAVVLLLLPFAGSAIASKAIAPAHVAGGGHVDSVSSFERWAQERYGLDIDVQSRSEISSGTEFGLADGRVAVVQSSLSGDGTSESDGLILVERSPDDEFPVQGDGH